MQTVTGSVARWWWLPLVLLYAGCAAMSEAPPPGHYLAAEEETLRRRVLGDEEDRFEPVDLLAIDAEVQRFVDENINPSWSSERKVVELRELLFAEEQLNIRYDGSETRTAMETYRTGRGNCLSMTSLFLAIARYAGLDAQYQVVSVKPTWEKSAEVMIRNDHINATGILASDRRYVVDFLPEIYIGDPDSYLISDQRARALYYNNLGAERIVAGDLDLAVKYLRTALAIEPEVSEVWNNMGTVMGKRGEKELAEFSYRHAIEVDSRSMTPMSNLARFYKAQGDMERADYYLVRVTRFRASNPYYLFFEARQAFAQADYESARSYLKRALRYKQDDAEIYFALANTYAALGETRESEKYRAIGKQLLTDLRARGPLQEIEVLIEGQLGLVH